jgi:hypothetical protein
MQRFVVKEMKHSEESGTSHSFSQHVCSIRCVHDFFQYLEVIELRNEELSDLYSLPNIVRVVKSRKMKLAGHVARMGEGRGVHGILVGRSEGKRRRWEDNIKMDLHEVGGGCGDWMELAQDRDRWRALVSTVMNFRVP